MRNRNKSKFSRGGGNQFNIQVSVLNNVFYDAQTMSDLENAKGVVLVERARYTLYEEIKQELELLNRQEIKVFGGIIVEWVSVEKERSHSWCSRSLYVKGL